MGPQERALFEQQMADQQKKTQMIENEKNALLLERRKLKGMVAAQKRNNKKGSKKSRGKKNKKKDFASVALTDHGQASAEKSVSFAEAENDIFKPKPEIESAEKSGGLHKKTESFRQHVSSDGHIYYCNVETQETVWTLPEGGLVL